MTTLLTPDEELILVIALDDWLEDNITNQEDELTRDRYGKTAALRERLATGWLTSPGEAQA